MPSGGDHGTLSGLFARTGTASADFPSAANPVRHDRAHYQDRSLRAAIACLTGLETYSIPFVDLTGRMEAIE